jgi:flagella basal body P-ring formation protein FlgA
MSRFALISCVLTMCVVPHVSAQRPHIASDPVSIELLPQAMVDDSVVTLSRIARISGGSASLRKRLENLDVSEFKVNTGRLTVAREHVQFRLMLAGVQPAQFDLAGAKSTFVTFGKEAMIKARDSVKIIAVVGAARIEAIGEALQDGGSGEVIRVRNVESNRIVSGKVESRGIVVVGY